MELQKLSLDKKTVVGYREWGPKNGTPLVFFHGFPGSSIQGVMFADICHELNFHVLAVDRLGYGSTLSAQGFDTYKLFVEKMELDKFYVFGVSGGAPSAVRLSEMFAERVLGLGIICGLIPLRNHEDKFPSGHRWALRTLSTLPSPLLTGFMSVLDQPRLRNILLDRLMLTLPDVDKRLFSRGDLLELMRISIENSREQGVLGIVNDIRDYASDWVGAERRYKGPVWVWHGDQDTILPVQMAQAWKILYPESQFKVIQGQGHYSLPINFMPEELLQLFRAQKSPDQGRSL